MKSIKKRWYMKQDNPSETTHLRKMLSKNPKFVVVHIKSEVTTDSDHSYCQQHNAFKFLQKSAHLVNRSRKVVSMLKPVQDRMPSSSTAYTLQDGAVVLL